MTAANSLREVISGGAYDGVLLDQYGVLHNGESAFPVALDAVRRLSASGVKVMILSNTSRRCNQTLDKLEAMGVHRSLITGAVTSGELMHGYLSSDVKSETSVLHLNWGPQRESIDIGGYPIRVAPCTFDIDGYFFPCPRKIELVLCHGVDGISMRDGSVSEVPYSVIERYLHILAREQPSIPFVCANPDLVTVAGSELRTMPGSLAETFAQAGGTSVTLLGKPHEVAYKSAIAALEGCGASKYLAIGDSLAHDILGAHAAGIDSLYIAGGIDAKHFGLDPSQVFDPTIYENWTYLPQTLHVLIRQTVPTLQNAAPTFVMPFLKW